MTAKSNPKQLHRGLGRMTDITISVERDLHDDTYFKITMGSFIVADRMNALDDVMLLVKAKLQELS